MNIFEIAGGPIDHVPPVMYEFEISCTKKADDREHFNTRVANMPTLINLSNQNQAQMTMCCGFDEQQNGKPEIIQELKHETNISAPIPMLNDDSDRL